MTAYPSTPGSSARVPLHMLFVSPLNVRRDDKSDVTELAALIRSQSVLQNLLAVPEMDGNDVTGYGIVGGGRRLRAMRLLESDGAIPADYAVPIQVVAPQDAEQVSLAENSGREAMHPADEFEAFRRQHDSGVPVEDIAAAFGVTPLVVQRRLKLANVSPKLIAEHRAGKIKLDQMMALAITDDHALQERTWEKADSWMRRPQELREALTKGTVRTSSSRIAKYIGIAAYEAAGGTVVRDLFGGLSDGYMTDEAMLDKLFADRMEAEADKLRAEGWAWVEAKDSIGYGDVYHFNRSKPTKRDLTPEEQAELEGINAKIASLKQRDMLPQEDDDEDDNYDEDAEDEIRDQIAALQAKAEAIEEGTRTYTANQRKKAGAMLGLNHRGQLEIHRGLIKPVDKKKATTSGESGDDAEPIGPAHPESLTRKLSAHRTAALQASLADNPHLALATLCYTLASQVLYSGGHYGLGVMRINAHQQFTGLTSHADDMEGSKAWQDMIERREAMRSFMPDDPTELFAWLQDQTTGLLVSILAYCTATCVDAVQHNESARPAAELAGALGLDMAEWWEPTATSYFKHLRKDSAIAVIEKVAGDQDKAKLAKMKKGELDQQAEKALAGTGWLPKILRAPDGAKKKAAQPEKKGTVTLSAEEWPFPTGKKD